MTKAHSTENEHLSALFDGEAQFNDLKFTEKERETFERYALLGDVVRAKPEQDIFIDIADKVAAQLESEPVYGDFSSSKTQQTSVDAVDKADESNVVSINWKKPLGQIALAASVAMFAIVGLQTLPGSNESAQGEAVPMFQTTPVGGGFASPVSYSTEPALENAKQGLRELQQQRIGALVLEHQRQARIATQAQVVDNEDTQSAKDSN